MKVPYADAKVILEFAKKAKDAKQMEDFLRTKYSKSVQEGLSYYAEAIDQHPELLNSMSSDDLSNLALFLSTKRLQVSPLGDKLSPAQMEKRLTQSSYPLLARLLKGN